MDHSFFIRARKLGGKFSYWLDDVGLHDGKNSRHGYSSYKTEREAKSMIRKLKTVFTSYVSFEALPCSELPFIKKQKRDWRILFNHAARLVVKEQKASARFLMDKLNVPVDKALLLMNRLRRYDILGEPFGKKRENFWQVEDHVSRRVKIHDLKTLKKKLGNYLFN